MEPKGDFDKEERWVDEALKRGKLESPSSNFTHRVMVNLHKVPVASGLSPKNGLLLLFGTILAVTVLTFLIAGGAFDGMNGTLSLEPVQTLPVDKRIPTSFSLNGKWIMNGLILVNIVLAFVLLDRTILKPYFAQRRNA